MTDTPWTPGPWKVTPRANKFIDVIHSRPFERGAITLALCRVQARNTWVDEASANARLIAAAPEMAEALANMVEIVDFVERRYGGRINPPTVDNARAILARIKGETP